MSSKKDWFIEAIKKEFIKSFDYNSFEAFKPIAKGGFGIVSKAYLKDADKVVALKCLYHGPTNEDEDSFDSFIREVRNIAKVDHDNIIRFFGITHDISLRVIKGERETPVNGSPLDFINLYRDAWDDDPNKRPNTNEIRDRLKDMNLTPVYHNVLSLSDPQILEPGNNENDGLGVHDHRVYGTYEQIYSIVQRFQELTVVNQNNTNVDESNDVQMDQTDHNDDVTTIQESNPLKAPNVDPNILNDGKEADLIDINESSIISISSNESVSNQYLRQICDIDMNLSNLPVINPDNAEELRNRGEAYYKSRNYEESLTELNRSLDIEPNNAFALRTRGATYYELGRYKESLEDLNKSLEIDPNNPLTLRIR
ncbi:10675_t:CDS:10 [Cetraspora pellucida]|uniref:10675_t:CDS:1 n=1 Tax=Cetraspora pellucida TaxID=1433469 RepID=A0A9N8YWP2_9GLOM|nr:10675_t:CDS:10 [Cetraspora pellucida]